MEELAIYVHVPYCVRKCAYCDFNAYSGAGSAQVQEFLEAVKREIAQSAHSGKNVSTIFFGGGTPTYLDARELNGIVSALRERFRVATDAEVSSEANPSTVDAQRFHAMFDAGFNRLSIGVQTFDDPRLQALDRTHTAAEALEAIASARQAGFRNLSIDLMFGLPRQSLADWRSSLETAISLDLPHLSTYALTLEPGTRFERLHRGGKLPLPSEDEELAMYEHAIDRLTAADYEHYEVSNFAWPGHRSRHNLVYWRNEEYLGFGPGAVSYVAGRRWTNERNPTLYAAAVARGASPAVESEELPPHSAMVETLIQGLRLREGVELGRLRDRFGIDPEAALSSKVEMLQRRGLVERSNGWVRLTHQGLLLANDVALELLP